MSYRYGSYVYHNGNDNDWSPFTYKLDSPFHIPPFNNHHHTPTEYTQPSLGFVHHKQYEDEPADYAQPQVNHNIAVGLNSAAAQLWLTVV
jgi:hypothetical protein